LPIKPAGNEGAARGGRGPVNRQGEGSILRTLHAPRNEKKPGGWGTQNKKKMVDTQETNRKWGGGVEGVLWGDQPKSGTGTGHVTHFNRTFRTGQVKRHVPPGKKNTAPLRFSRQEEGGRWDDKTP